LGQRLCLYTDTKQHLPGFGIKNEKLDKQKGGRRDDKSRLKEGEGVWGF
jgi:hypothetical protein